MTSSFYIQHLIVPHIRKYDHEDITALLADLSRGKERECTNALLERQARDTNALRVVARSELGDDKDRIIGHGIISLVHKADGYEANIQDVIVRDAYRGFGVGKAIMLELISWAKKQPRVSSIFLTNARRPERSTARILYRRLGFQDAVTDPFELVL